MSDEGFMPSYSETRIISMKYRMYLTLYLIMVSGKVGARESDKRVILVFAALSVIEILKRYNRKKPG